MIRSPRGPFPEHQAQATLLLLSQPVRIQHLLNLAGSGEASIKPSVVRVLAKSAKPMVPSPLALTGDNIRDRREWELLIEEHVEFLQGHIHHLALGLGREASVFDRIEALLMKGPVKPLLLACLLVSYSTVVNWLYNGPIHGVITGKVYSYPKKNLGAIGLSQDALIHMAVECALCLIWMYKTPSISGLICKYLGKRLGYKLQQVQRKAEAEDFAIRNLKSFSGSSIRNRENHDS
jgi:hypothetical protein